MTKKLKAYAFFPVFLLASASAFAQAININFDTDPVGSPVASGTNLVSDATYSSLGVTFARVGGSVCGPDVYANNNHPGDFGSPPNTVSTCAPSTASDINGQIHGQIQVNFDFPANQACIAVRPDSGNLAGNITAYDSGDNVVDSQTSAPGVNETVCVNGNDIRYVRFPGLGGTDTEYARFDDLSVTGPGPQLEVTAPIQTLSEWAMILLTLLLAGGAFFALTPRRS